MVKVACVQQKVTIHPDEDSFGADVYKFAAEAKEQGCRLIAYPEGCEAMLVIQFMARPLVRPGSLIWHKIRAGAWARCQDNQTYGMHSCLVGKNDVSKKYTDSYIGPSSIIAPLDLTPNYSGIMAETKTHDQEELITAQWDMAALEEMRSTSDTKIHAEMRPDVYRRYLTWGASE